MVTKTPADSVQHAGGAAPVATFAWYGTSIMQHPVAYNARMSDQADLLPVGSQVSVEQWVNRGYVHRLHTTLQVHHPRLVVDFRNHADGGATSRDILKIARHATGQHEPDSTVSMLGCGVIGPVGK